MTCPALLIFHIPIMHMQCQGSELSERCVFTRLKITKQIRTVQKFIQLHFPLRRNRPQFRRDMMRFTPTITPLLTASRVTGTDRHGSTCESGLRIECFRRVSPRGHRRTSHRRPQEQHHAVSLGVRPVTETPCRTISTERMTPEAEIPK